MADIVLLSMSLGLVLFMLNEPVVSGPVPNNSSATEQHFDMDKISETSPDKKGCCISQNNYCGGGLLESLCPGEQFHSDSLYGCALGQRPRLIEACQNGCDVRRFGKDDACLSNITESSFREYLPPNGVLLRGQTLWSATNQTKLILQTDGNLVLYRTEDASDRAEWASGTQRFVQKTGYPASVQLQKDGDLFMFNQEGVVIWRLGTGQPQYAGSVLRVVDCDGGKLCLSQSETSWMCVWSVPSPSRVPSSHPHLRG